MKRLFIIFIFLGLFFSSLFAQEFSHKYKALYVPAGKIITFSLESDSAAGYGWHLARITNKRVLEFVEKSVQGSTIEMWSFKTLNSGESVILMEYKKGKEPAIEKIEYKVFVK